MSLVVGLSLSAKEIVLAVIGSGLVVLAGSAVLEQVKSPNINIETKNTTLDNDALTTILAVKNNGFSTAHNVRITINSNVDISRNMTTYTDASTQQDNGQRSEIVSIPRFSPDSSITYRIGFNSSQADRIVLSIFAAYDERSNGEAFTFNKSLMTFEPTPENYIQLLVTLNIFMIIGTSIGAAISFIILIKQRNRYKNVATYVGKGYAGKTNAEIHNEVTTIIKSEILDALSLLKTNIKSNSLISTTNWDSLPRKARTILFDQTEYDGIENFYKKVRERNGRMETGNIESGSLSETNQECYTLGYAALKDTNWTIKVQRKQKRLRDDEQSILPS